MNVISRISVDLTLTNVGQRVNAVQGDGNTRSVEITLRSGGEPWTPPEGVEAAIAYQQPGRGAKGLYNQLADGSAAISITENVATVILAPQMLTAPGTVQASLVFNDAQLNRLTTFPFSVFVEGNPAAGAQKTEDYIRLQWLEGKLEKYLAAIKASGAFDGKPGDPGRDYDHSPEFTALAAEMSGYQQQVAEDRQKIADAADAVDASAKAAADSAGIAAGAQKAAEGAATAAVKSAEDAERYAEESQQAVDSLRPVVSKIKDDLSDLAPAGAAVGQLFRVAAISDDGKYTMEPVDMLDVKIDGASIVQDGVANIPFATASQAGVAKFTENQGMRAYGKYVGLKTTTNNEINERYTIGNKGGAILTQNFDYAVKAAMCDGKGTVWTAEEQAAARERMGLIEYELVVDVPTLETASNFHISSDSNGNELALKAVAIDFAGADGGESCLIEINNGYLKFIASLSNGRFGTLLGLPISHDYYYYCLTYNAPNTTQPNPNGNQFISGLKGSTLITDIWFRGTVPAGASIRIYGIRG